LRDSSTSAPSTVTRRAWKSTLSPPMTTGSDGPLSPPTAERFERRSTARMRAITSAPENGLTT
jgi:hypothetical protein